MPLKNFLYYCLFLSFLFISVSASSQTEQKDSYNESDYTEVSQGIWNRYFVVTFENKINNHLKIRILYNDSTKDKSMYFKYFFIDDIMNGPYFVYSNGKLFKKGFMKNNKRDGEEISYYSDSIITEKAYYNFGKKVGIWEQYMTTGELISKTYYDSNGLFLKREIFDVFGKLARTELIE